MRELRAEHLTKRFGKTTALDDVSLSFEYGKIHALLGRNGAGKTTLLGIASNRLVPTEGRILVDGELCTWMTSSSRWVASTRGSTCLLYTSRCV